MLPADRWGGGGVSRGRRTPIYVCVQPVEEGTRGGARKGAVDGGGARRASGRAGGVEAPF